MSSNLLPSGAIRSVSVNVSAPAGDLEALVDEPESLRDAAAVAHVGIVCHPHPLFGGTMTNKVAHILARTFNDLDAPAVRFNFRGVGKSAGVHDDGKGETEDTLAILRWSQARWPNAALSLAGFSFGAAMALRAALQYPVARLITVAPALRWLQGLDGAVPRCPWLIVQGDRDELVDVNAVQAWATTLATPPEIKIVADAEHFFHGRLNDVRDIVKQWMAANA